MEELTIGETYAILRKDKQKKKARNRKNSIDLLIQNNISFEMKNNGLHLIVECTKGPIDYWPSTGKFVVRSAGKQGRGVFKLIEECNEK